MRAAAAEAGVFGWLCRAGLGAGPRVAKRALVLLEVLAREVPPSFFFALVIDSTLQHILQNILKFQRILRRNIWKLE